MSRRGPKPSTLPQARSKPGDSWSEDSATTDWSRTADHDAAGRLAERLRRLALGLLAALLVARAYWPSEPDLKAGAGDGLGWVFAVLLVAALALASSFAARRLTFRFSWVDAAVVGLVFLVASSARMAVDWRVGVNLAWEWVGLGTAYLLLRNLPRSRAESSALALALTATAGAVGVYGLYQVGVELPQLQADYLRNPVPTLLKMNIPPDSPARRAFEQRLLHSNEPFSTFGLANSLAGFLVGPLALLLGTALRNLAGSRGGGSRWGALAAAVPPGFLMLVCLILTKSRSAYLGLLVAALILAWRSRRLVPRRALLGMAAAGVVVVVGLVAAGLATGRLDRQVLTQSGLSMRYRLEYWQGAWGVITEGAPTVSGALRSGAFWAGVGPGNFGPRYLQHKLPQASEEIQDPHNAPLEVWATAGVWALLCFAAAVGLGLWLLLRADETDDDDRPERATWLVIAAGLGWAMVLALGQLNLFQDELLARWLILGLAWGFSAFFLAPLWRGASPPAFAFGAALAAVAVNLLAAGGIGIPTVALAFWGLLALGLNHRENAPCGRLRTVQGWLPGFGAAAVWAAVVGLFLGATIPFWRSEAALAEAEAAMNRLPPDFERAESAYRRAERLDRFNPRPWLGHAYLQYQVWESRGAKPEDLRWRTIPALLLKAVSPPRGTDSWSLHFERANVIRDLLGRVGPSLAPLEAIQLRSGIVEATRTASRLHPTNATLHAALAEASAEISMFQDAAKEGREALRLDALTPHPDKKLAAPVRDRLQAKLPEWTEKAEQAPTLSP